jgi:aspartyl-tRNA(Asn)/glutamyl-tRNA(Gln) amidotransferase subunit C
MKIDSGQINKVAKLARLELTENEQADFSKQLSGIINYVEKINELDTSSVRAADHIVDLNNVFREDKQTGSIDRDEINRIAPEFDSGHFIVPKIIE